MGRTLLGDIPGTEAELIQFGVAELTAGIKEDIDLGAKFSDAEGEFAVYLQHLPGTTDAVQNLPWLQVTKITPATENANTKITVRAAKVKSNSVASTLVIDAGTTTVTSTAANGDIISGDTCAPHAHDVEADTAYSGKFYWIAVGRKKA